MPLSPAHHPPARTTVAAVLVAAVIPCHRVSRHILAVLAKIGPEVASIYVVDDACPEQSGKLVAQKVRDPRVKVIFHPKNRGVGEATLSGYAAAIADGMDIIVKIDGDGQMDPRLVAVFIQPILAGEADYTKGNRFFHLESLRTMPPLRTFGNAVLSLMCKFSTGYWDIVDPTNGYTAIHARVARLLPRHKISSRYFFESDLLFRLNNLRAVVQDIPMVAVYGDEESGLKVRRIVGEFLFKNIRNFGKRMFYSYVLRDFNVATVEMAVGLMAFTGGSGFGFYQWILSSSSRVPASSGTVMLAAMPIIIGIQFMLSALAYDLQKVPKTSLHPRLVAAEHRQLAGGQFVGRAAPPPNAPGVA